MDKFLQVIYSEYAPSSKNYMWVNSNDGLIYVFHEGKWKELSGGGGSLDVTDVVASGTAEDRNRLPNPNDGMLFMQRDNTGYNKLFIYKNNTWREFLPDVDSHDLFHICSASEYNPETLVPTVASPKDNTFYLVPSGDDNDIYKEWIYVDDAWELFGSAKVSPQSQVIVATCSTIPDLGNPSVWFFYKPEDVSFSNTGVQTLRNPMNATEFISWMNSNRVKFTQAPPRLRLLCYETIQTWEGGGAYYTLTHFYNNNDFGFSIVNCKDKNYCVLYGFGYDSVNGWYSKKTQYPVELWSAASVDDQTVFSCEALGLHNLTPKQLGQHLYDNYTDYTTTKTFALNYVGHLLTGILTKDTDTQKLQWEAEIIHDQVNVTPGSGTAEVGKENRITCHIFYDANDDTKCLFVVVPIVSIDKGDVTYYYYGSTEDYQAGTYIKLARNGQQTTLTYQQFLDDLYNNRAEINQRNAQLILITNTTPTLSQGISIYDMILFQAITDSDNHEFVQVEFNIVSDNVMTMNENDRKIIYNSLFFKKQWDTANNQYAYIAKRALRELGEFVEVQSSLPSSLTSKDLGHYSIVDDTIYKVVQDGSNYVWEKQIPPTDTIDKGEMIYYVTKDIIDETSSNYENPASTTYYKPQLYDAEPLSFDLTEFLRDVFRNGRQGMELNARRGAKLIVEFLPRKNSNYSENQKIFHLAYVRQIPTSSISTSVNWIISFQGLNYTIDTESVSEKINYEIVNIEYKFRTPPTGALIYPSVTVTRTRIPSTNYIETQTSLPTGLTAEDLNRHCIVDNQLYKVVQDNSDYVWQKIKNLYSNVILFGYGSWIMTDEHGVEINNFQWRKPDGSAIAWADVSSYIHNEIVTRQTHTTAMSGISSQGWQVQESIYICMQDTERPTYNLLFELQSVFLDGSNGWSATCLERSIEEKSSGGFERSITQTYHMFYLPPTYAPNGRLTKDVIYGDVMVANDLPAARDIHLGKCAIVGNKLYKCSYVSGSYQWDEVPIGKDNAIIDVTTLPTTDIQTESLYRVAGQVFYEGTDVTEFGLYKFTEFGIEKGCIADANTIKVLDGVNQPITYSWKSFNAINIYNNIEFSHSIEKTLVPTEADFALIDTLPQSPGTSKSNIARHISVCEIIPSKLYHYKDNAWIQIQPTTAPSLTTTDKTIVGSINELNTNKAPMDNVKVTGNITWGADLFWDIDTVITSEMKIKLATVNIPFLGTGNCNGTMIIIERRASATVESQLFIEFYANQSSNNSQVQSPYNKFFLAGTLDASYNGQFKTYFDNIAWSDWQRIEIGSHNTLASSTIQSVDECIFPFIYHRGNRTFKDSRVYLASMTDPISGTTINGECHTVEVTRSEKLIVEQTFTRFNSSENTRIVYFRRGVHTFDTQTGDWGDNADVIANIGWQDWYPIEYPDTDLVLKTGWTGNIHFSVTGGILLINVLNLVKTASATSALPLDATANSGLITLPFKYVVWGTIFNSNSVALLKVKWQQQTESQEGGFVTSTLMVADEPYLGTLQIHLGY